MAAETGTRARVRRGADRGLVALRALIPLARRVASVVRAYAAIAAAAGLVIVVVALRNGLPGSEIQWGALVATTVIVAGPPIVLWLFSSALLDALSLPDQLATNPELMRSHGRELASLARDAHAQAGGSVRRIRLRRGDVWRAGRLLLGAHRDLPGYGGALRLVSVPFLIVTLFAAFLAALVIVLAPLTVLLALLVG